jgi:hypothetical protein
VTPDRFNQCLEALHWSTEQLAAIFECDEGLTEAWSLGFEEVPPKAAAWLQALASVHEAMEKERPVSLKGKRARGDWQWPEMRQ